MIRPTPVQLSASFALLCAASALAIGLQPSPRAPDRAPDSFAAWGEAPVMEKTAEALVPAPQADEAAPDEVLQGQASKAKSIKKPPKLKPALLIVVTDFDKVDVTVNGKPYPEFVPADGQRGVVLPAGGPHMVVARSGEKSKVYEIGLGAYETRYIVIEPGALGNGVIPAPPPAPPSVSVKANTAKNEQTPEPIIDPNSDVGKVTVYSKPPGEIFVDDKPFGQKTPYTVDVDEGRHELQVRYENGAMSEKKIVRARKGSRIKLFFRQAE
jgi:hypothetical protein